MKPTKKIPSTKEKYKDTFTAHEVGVILEGIKSDSKLLFEKFESLEEKFGSLEGKFESLEGKFGNLRESVDIIAINQTKTLDRISALEVGQKLLIKRIDELEKKISSIDKRLVSVETDIKEIKESLKTQVDLQKFIVLEKRVSKIEMQVVSMTSK